MTTTDALFNLEDMTGDSEPVTLAEILAENELSDDDAQAFASAAVGDTVLVSIGGGFGEAVRVR
jgi:hypothetical protein